MNVGPLRISDRRLVGPKQPTFVIAEIGQNHNGRLDWAEQLVDAAAWAGADAVKTVKRDLSCELTASARRRRYDSPHSFGATYGEHRQALELDVAAHAALAARARSHGLHFIATVCDIPSAAALDEIGVDAFKIASRDLGNLPLVEFVARRGRPIILSTGMSDWCEIDAAVTTARRHTRDYAVLQCTSLYPAPDGDVHLRALPELARRFEAVVGYSDHTLGIDIAPAAVALGAAIVEKHVTLDCRAKGSDHACSVEPPELARLVERIRRVEAALGTAEKRVEPGVAANRNKLGRSLVARSDLPAGTVLHDNLLTLKSPGDGVRWFERDRLLGRRLVRDVPADCLLSLDDVA
jgi:N-acetylneuraminate synthase/sialic acid synthase